MLLLYLSIFSFLRSVCFAWGTLLALVLPCVVISMQHCKRKLETLDWRMDSTSREASYREEEELAAIEAVGAQLDDTPTPGNHHPFDGDDSFPVPAKSRSRSNEAAIAQGRVIGTAAVFLGESEEDVCGVCLENFGAGKMVSLWCCKNVLCIQDAQRIGACPFCRGEPLMWNLRV